MTGRESLRGVLIWFGIIALVSIVAWIAMAWLVNPWFDFYTGALSALGSPGATDPWIYNVGLMFTAVLIVVYSAGLMLYNRNRIEDIGSSFLIVAAVFLALIGIYHGGTYPHDFVSTWFFIQADMAIFVWGIGAFFHRKIMGVYSVGIGLMATIIAYGLNWPSSAELETFGTSAIALWVVLTFIFLRRETLKAA